jgi:hypothetical protein
VNGTINITCKDRIIKSPDKDPLPADLMERHSGSGITLGVHDDLFGIDAQS